jgi:uncharacterized protein (TIGR02996 family)
VSFSPTTERYTRRGQFWQITYREYELAIVDETGVLRTETAMTRAFPRFDELTRERVRDGWKLVVPEGEPVPVYDLRNAELEAPPLADPYDRAAWLVYGDWLQQHGDPRGEYIALRAAWLANGRDGAAWGRLSACELRHGARFRGRLTNGELGWGFVEGIELTQYLPEETASPEARFLAHASISSGYEGGADLAIARRGPVLPVTLRVLTIGGNAVTDLAPLAHVLDHLHALAIVALVSPVAYAQLAAHPLAALRKLDLEDLDRGAALPRALLACELPALIILELGLMSIDAALVEAIANAPYAARLTTVSLWFLDDAGARALIANVDRFPALIELRVDDYRMSADMTQALRVAPGMDRVLQWSRHPAVDYGPP